MLYKLIFFRFIIIFLSLNFSLLVKGQNNYMSGYIVNLQGDTIVGRIFYSNWLRNPEYITFKQDSSNNTNNYYPRDIIEFCVLNDKYKSAIVNIEANPDRIENLKYSMKLNFIKDTVFLFTIIEGNKSLYSLKVWNEKEQYYIKINNNYELLIYQQYLKYSEKERNEVLAENKKYIGQLIYYFNEFPALHENIRTIEYKRKSLENIFLKYYTLTNNKVTFINDEKILKTELGVLFGVSISDLTFKGVEDSYLILTDFKSSINFSAGLYFNVILPRNFSKWSIYNELLYTRYNTKGIYNPNNYTEVKSEIKFDYLRINNSIRYKFLITGDMWGFVNVGLSSHFAINSSTSKRVNSNIYGNENGEAINKPRKIEFGKNFGFGLNINRYSIIYNYGISSNMSPYVYISSQVYRHFILLGYKLF